MKQTSGPAKQPAEEVVKDIRRATRRHFSTEDKIRVMLEHSFLPGDLEAQVGAFIAHDNHARAHEGLSNLTPADVYFGRSEAILLERERIKRRTFACRCLLHHAKVA